MEKLDDWSVEDSQSSGSDSQANTFATYAAPQVSNVNKSISGAAKKRQTRGKSAIAPPKTPLSDKSTSSKKKSSKKVKKPRIKKTKPLLGPPITSSIFEIDLVRILDPRFELPKLGRLKHSDGIELLGELFGMADLDYNLVSYWTLEVVSEVIKKSQEKSMIMINQKMCIIWIVYILMKISQHRVDRKQMFKHLCLLFIRGVKKLPELVHLPNPFVLQTGYPKTQTTNEAPEFSDKFSSMFPNRGQTPSVENLNVGYMEKESEIFPPTLETIFPLFEPSEGFFFPPKSEEKLTENSEVKLPPIADQLPEEIKTKIKLLADELKETRRANDRDFRQLIKMVYRIFANRFKYAVIFEAFSNPPLFRTIRVIKRILIPKLAIGTPQIGGKKRSKSSRSILSPASRSTKVSTKFSSTIASKSSSKLKISGDLIESQIDETSKYIRPLSEAVNDKFFKWVADYNLKELKYSQYCQQLANTKDELQLGEMDDKEMLEQLQEVVDRSRLKKYSKRSIKPSKTSITGKLEKNIIDN